MFAAPCVKCRVYVVEIALSNTPAACPSVQCVLDLLQNNRVASFFFGRLGRRAFCKILGPPLSIECRSVLAGYLHAIVMPSVGKAANSLHSRRIGRRPIGQSHYSPSR